MKAPEILAMDWTDDGTEDDAWIAALTGIRGLAIGIVFMSHLSIAGYLPWQLGRGTGQLGVMLFFLLSGFLMTRRYGLRTMDGTRIARFIAARCGRVVPLYLLVVIVSFLVAGSFAPWPYQLLTGSDLAKHLFLIEGYEALWAVPIEMQFYGVFLILAFLSGENRGRLLWVSGIFMVVGFAVAYALFWQGVEGRRLPGFLHYFLAGVILAVLVRRRPQVSPLTGVIASLVIGLIFLTSFPYVRLKLGVPLHAWLDPLVMVSVILVFLGAYWRLGLFRMLEWRISVALGTISYGVYIFNPIVINLCGYYLGGLGTLVNLGLIVALTLGVSALSFVALERPAMQRIRRLVR